MISVELKITSKEEEPLLSRTKILSEIYFDAATPTGKDVKAKLASSLNAKDKLLVVRGIYTNYGFKKADVTAYLYKDEKNMQSIEIKNKNQEEKEKKKEPQGNSKKGS